MISSDEIKSPTQILQGWIFDLYPSPHGMTLWLIEPNQTRHRLIDRFAPVFYVSGPDAVLRRLHGEAARQPHALACRVTERMDLWEQRARPVLEIEVAHPNEYSSWTRWVRQFDTLAAALQQRPDARVALLLAARRLSAGARAKSKWMAMAASSRSNAATPNGRSTTSCRRSKSCACASAACSGIDPTHGSQTALEIEVDGREFELDESGEPAAVAFQHLLARHDPDLILSDWGDATILPRLREQAANCACRSRSTAIPTPKCSRAARAAS